MHGYKASVEVLLPLLLSLAACGTAKSDAEAEDRCVTCDSVYDSASCPEECGGACTNQCD